MDFKNVTQAEKFLSNMRFNSQLYTGDHDNFNGALFKLLNAESSLAFAEKDFITSPLYSIDQMASSVISLSFICFLAKLKKPNLMIEIGSFIGFSTSNLASSLPKDGKLISIEKFNKFAEIALKNIQRFGLVDRVSIEVGDAKHVLPNLNLEGQLVDFAFVDGNKEDYTTYVNWFLANLSDDGLIIVDDIFFHGDVLNEERKTEKGKGVFRALESIQQNKGVYYCILPISNGLMLIGKK